MGEERASRPLFAQEDHRPYSHAILGLMLTAVLTFLFGASVAALFTFHSYRSGLATALHASGCPDAMIMLICRWMCPESLHIYRRMTGKEHETHIRNGLSANVDLIQSANVVKVDGGAGVAKLNSAFGSAILEKAVKAEFDAAKAVTPKAVARAVKAEPVAKQSKAVVSDAPPPDLSPITPLNAAGRRVMIPRAVFPSYACTECDGLGWEAKVLTATAVTAIVRHVHAKTPDGRPYEEMRLQMASLSLL